MAMFSSDWKYRGEGNSSLVMANTAVSVHFVSDYAVSRANLNPAIELFGIC